MALPQGINFRATTGFVTDGTNESAETANGGTGALYPRTTAQGNTVGWENPIGQVRDRTTGNDRRLAGMNFTSASGWTFRIDLPSAGSYNVRAAFGDASSVNPTAYSLVDTSAVLAALCTGTNNNANSFKDANNIEWTAAAWPASNTARTATFATTILRVRSDDAGANLITHFYVESAGGGSTNTPINPGVGSVSATSTGPTVARTANQFLAPGSSSIRIAGFAPTVSISASQNINPGAGCIGTSGFAPSISQPHAVNASAGALTFGGFAPAITQAINQGINPAAPRALVLAGFAVTVSQSNNRSAAPGVASLAVRGYAPSIAQTTITPPTYSGTIQFQPLRTKTMRVVRLA